MANFVIYIRSMTPIRTATPPPGEDTPWRGIAVKQNGRIVADVAHQYRCKVHENKKNGGLAYTAWSELKFSTAADSSMSVTWAVLNASRGSEELVQGYINNVESQVQPQLQTVLPLPGPSRIRVIDQANLGSACATVVSSVAALVVGRIEGLFTNHDGPVAFNTVTIEKPLQIPVDQPVDLGASCNGLSGRSFYHVDAVLYRTT